MPIYSFGKDSPLKINITDRQATTYNRCTQAFFDAQLRWMEENQIPWTPDQPLQINVKNREVRTYNAVGKIINHVLDTAGRVFTEEDLPEDFLVKN